MPPRDRFATAVNYYGPTGFDPATLDAVQLVWADDDGTWPWEATAPPRLRRLQSILGGALRAG
jgi:hypothetical protein